jgi:hypothetical protein
MEKIGRTDRKIPISKIGRKALQKSDGKPAKNRTDVKKMDLPLFV